MTAYLHRISPTPETLIIDWKNGRPIMGLKIEQPRT